MANTVKVPLLGTHNKGTVVGVTIGGLAVAGYLIWRNQKQAAAQAQASSQAANTAAAAAGYGYGQQSNFGYGYFGYGEPGGPYGYGASGGFMPTGYYGYGTPQPPGGNLPVTTNAQWTQAAMAQLGQSGFQPRAVLDALGKYINGVEVTPAQETIIQGAIAVEGYPPQPGKNGNPPGIVVSHGGQGGQGKDLDFVEAAGHAGLAQIGAEHDVAPGTMDRLNPSLFARYGNKRDIPSGTKVRVH